MTTPNTNVRPYTPREAVEHLGREMTYLRYPKGRYVLQMVGEKYALIAGDMGYETYANIAKWFIWTDTEQPCGIEHKGV